MRRWKSVSAATPRISLYFWSAPLLLGASSLSGIGFVLSSGLALIAGTVVWIGWFLVLFLVAAPQTDRKLKKHSSLLRRVALVIIISLGAVGIGQTIVLVVLASTSHPSNELMDAFNNSIAYNDATLLTHQAMSSLLRGENPYRGSNIVKAIIEHNGTYDKVTPLRLGRLKDVFPYPTAAELQALWDAVSADPTHVPVELESKFNYPAGSFLLPALFLDLGIDDLRFIYAIFIFLALTYVIWILRDRKFFFIVAMITALEIGFSIACGETGGLPFAFLLVAWVLLPRRLWISTVLLGVAVATKQTAWFYLPYFIIYIYTMVSHRKVLPVLTIIAAIFLAMNLPFFVGDPVLWIRSVFAPMTDPMFPIGVGIVTVVTGGLLDIHSSLPFTIIELAVMAASIVWFGKNCRKYPNTAPLLAILPLFFAWRSLWPYFYYANVITLAGILANEYGEKQLIKPIDEQ